MKRSVLIIVLLFSTFLLKAQYSKDYLKTDDIYKALNIMGLNIYKYPLFSNESYDFNLLYEEFSDGKCVDSARLISDEIIKKLKNLIGQSLTIQNDTTFLSIFVQQKDDSLFTFNFSYSFFASKKEIVLSKVKYGEHHLREFASPKITARGKYPILILSSSWEQNIKGETVSRFCFPDDIEQIKMLVKHFYVLSVISD